MRPRKSSTSSARRRPTYRARYLGVEVTATPSDLPFPGWDAIRPEAGPPPLEFRVVRSDGRRAIVEVAHTDLPRARTAFAPELRLAGNGRVPCLTRRTWGTLRGAKAWLARRGS